MLDYLVTLPRPVKRHILLFIDILLVPLSLFISLVLLFDTLSPVKLLWEAWPLFVMTPIVATPIFLRIGLNRIKLMAFEAHDMRRGAFAALSVAAITAAETYAFNLDLPRAVAVLTGPAFLLLHLGLRTLGRNLLVRRINVGNGRMPVAIYGAGSAGVQLLAALRQDFQMRPVTFVDDNVTLQTMTVSGMEVCSRAQLEAKVRRGEIQRVLLAMPSVSEPRMRRLTQELSEFGCEVHALPTYSELVEGTGLASNLRPVTPDRLLGRDKVDLETPEVARAYAGRRVLITGAGGSIGSELCRQIILCGPQRLTLLDHSEFALYEISRELVPLAEMHGVELVTRLGSVCDPDRMAHIMAESEIDIVLFAAAYKHVPLVEENEIEGLRNNLFGTLTTAEAAQKAGVERFILVSTDKAVRPTNIMGASKRLAELSIQDLQTRSEVTKFAMVRFGNVLGSSGSVIPLFQSQIAAGGPITLTHEKITRYFMTISEAARLVLLAGAYATGGDVFVLDMGAPVNIRDLARRMVELTGLTVRDEKNPHGDIDIETVGLRPGEKLYEELLIGNNILPTPHEKIMRAEERRLSQIEMARILKQIRAAIAANDPAAVRSIIEANVDGFHVAETGLDDVV
ncbi:polysaccharide biosynthesis protein [Litoreibacter janthinus]|uniref:NDP-sugar epimerase, includes UDP-GlcNAc-inverting 4,6-dehydratase FlaA1 and capsular polysaccharide biosynthesis protein EpsC n=1 Tax=Litoreibacter janthinus TaxID=670154 RepID=A0A1I6G1L7_9RHOB|nr:nucleoside-diphosphate sugar epimerase/dehydratase [Litoreibacter janthinus]SFR36075.1 NDP-sugar epimerase, includes UDP-GlcNAc-inverting 4,6-dehydratase FlaA1 and capsular polysaccharide biosynthesis protein EpsC [Litoreibacter janthinus]